MVNFTLSKGDHDGFSALHPKSLYQDKFKNPAVVYDSEYAYYTRKILQKIEQRYPDAEKQISYVTINSNSAVVEDEILYIDYATQTIIALKLYWELGDYITDQEQTPCVEPDVFEELDEHGPKKIKIGKNSKFQAKITMYTSKDTPDLKKFFQKSISHKRQAKKKEREMNIVCFSGSEGLYLKTFKTNNVDVSIEDNYNDDFKEISDLVVKRLNTKGDNGIVLFHSDPGCGKTSYLRYLTQKITKKRLIYLPPDMAHKLSDPDFMGFLMNYSDSVLLIEDAENCLQKRDTGGNQAVSNLLNNSDGLLGDALRLQIVCTFNCGLEQIDDALLRDGRLIAEYKFEKLSQDKTKALIQKLYGEDSEHLHRVQEMTLAQIYNLDKKKFKSRAKGSGKVGFSFNK